MSEYVYKPYSRTREIMAAIGEIVGCAIGFGIMAVAGYIFLAAA